jgi:hypothetical protein
VPYRTLTFQQALYRAYYDAYLRDRLIAETAQETAAIDCLRRARRIGALPALEEAHAVLSQATRMPVSEDRRTRVNELAEALYQSVRMQLGSERYNRGGERRKTPWTRRSIAATGWSAISMKCATRETREIASARST